MRIQKNLSKDEEPSSESHSAEDSARILHKLKVMREQIGRDHLKIMNKDRGEIMAKTKIELLEVYAEQIAGRITLDNKQINELTTSSGTEEDLSELSTLEDEEA